MKVGVIGGTFDPLHNGHLAIAGAAREGLGLEKVIFVPGGRVRLRETAPAATGPQRAEMVRLALAGRPDFALSLVDLERPGPTRTVDTLTDLRAGLGAEAELFFIIGQDILGELSRWWQPERLIELCRLVAVPRPGSPAPDIAALEKAVPGIASRLVMLETPGPDISATDVRGRVRRGLPVGHLVPAPVADYIREHGLYLEPAPEPGTA